MSRPEVWLVLTEKGHVMYTTDCADEAREMALAYAEGFGARAWRVTGLQPFESWVRLEAPKVTT